MSPKVLFLLGSNSDLPITEGGLALLRELGVSFALRIGSAHRTPEHVHRLVTEHDQGGTKVFVCVAGMSAHLAGVVASLTTKPVVAVPVSGAATAGLDALLSMVNMPPGVPVATVGFDKAGFKNACLLAAQIIAQSEPKLAEQVKAFREGMTQQVLAKDEDCKIVFGLS